MMCHIDYVGLLNVHMKHSGVLYR